jgi:signal peptidase I
MDISGDLSGDLPPADGASPEVAGHGAQPPPAARRRWWVAALLGIAGTGLGQLYNGQPRKGLLVLASGFLTASLGFALATRRVPFWLPMTLILVSLALALYLLIDAVVQAARTGASYRLRAYNRWYVYSSAVAILSIGGQLWIGAIHYVVTTFRIPSGVNAPTIMIGDHLFAKMATPRSEPVRRGDFVIFHSPEGAHLVLMRVVALGGDRLEIHDKELSVNGRMLNEPYAVHQDPRIYRGDSATMSQRDNLAPQTVPAGSLFVLGDNRDNSYDSRFYGPISQDLVISHGPLRVYWSWDSDSRHTRWSRTGRFIE